jgi:nitroreductase
MRSRHSVRTDYDPARHLSPSDLEDILEAARWAPTPHNMQNFEIVIVDDPALLGEAGEIPVTVSPLFLSENLPQVAPSVHELRRRRTGILGTNFPPAWLDPEAWGDIGSDEFRHTLADDLQGCPTLLVVLYDESRRAPASVGDVLGFMGLGCVLENMWLAAQELGLSMQVLATMASPEVESSVKELLGVPAPLRIAFGARLGVPLASPTLGVRVRRDIEDFAYRNDYGRRVVVSAIGVR